MDIKFKTNLTDYVLSGHSLLYISTFEKERSSEEIEKTCKEIGKNTFIWSISSGWKTIGGNSIEGKSQCQPPMVISSILGFPENSIFILKEFWPYIQKETFNEFDIIISQISEAKEQLSHDGKTIIFLGPEFQIPNSLKHDITTIDFSLPNKEQIKNSIMFVAESVKTQDGKPFEINSEMMEDVIRACQGMTSSEIIDRVSLSIRKHKKIDKNAIKTILNEKASVIKASGLLTYIEPPEGGLDNIGGYDILKRNILLDKPCFSEDAKKFGIENPKGNLLVGIPGCGKTEIGKCIASEFNQPLISLDVGSIMSSYVGSSEQNMRQAIKVIESVAPCVLLMDEIEKGFGGGSDLDGGASLRVFGTFLKWLSEQNTVYGLATANKISGLPPEFFRSGRFDSVFFLDLPNDAERKTILKIHLNKRKRDASKFDLNKIIEMTKDYAGSDLEQIVKMGLKIAFCMKEELTQDHLEMAVKSVIPLSKIEPQRISSIREWGTTHAKQANSEPEKVVEKNRGRKVSV